MRPKDDATIAARFWPKVTKTDTCWLWTGGYLNAYGYGAINVGGRAGRDWLAHRVAYELAVGPIPAGADLDHLCRVRHCVNPKHLEPVTRLVNVQRGNGVKLSPQEVLDIKARLADGQTQKAVAATYGVGKSTVWAIASGRSWGWLT